MAKQFRPQSWQDFSGQSTAIENLKMYVEYARSQKMRMKHTMLLGGPGLGKTTLSKVIANELSAEYKYVFCPASNDIIAFIELFENCVDGDIIFLDEIHRLTKKFQEALYTVLEDNVFHYINGTGKNRQVIKLDVPEITIIAGTTSPASLHPALRRRFELDIILNPYSVSELTEMAINTASRIYNIQLQNDIALKIAQLSHGSASVCKNFIERYSVAKTVRHENNDQQNLSYILRISGVDKELGLDSNARKVLLMLEKGQVIAKEYLAIGAKVEIETYTEIIEPKLLENYTHPAFNGPLIEVLPKGRRITATGAKYLQYIKMFKSKNDNWFTGEVL